MKYKLPVISIAVVLAASAAAPARKPLSPVKELKIEQKAARKRLKLEEKAWKRSFHGRPMPSAERVLTKREYQQYMRNLRIRQKEELKQLKEQLRR